MELQASFLRVEEHARVRIADVVATTEEALRSIQEEKSKAASALATAQAELSLLNDLKRQVLLKFKR